MNSLFTKLKSNSTKALHVNDTKQSSDYCVEENTLGEEQETATVAISGTLAIADLTLKTPTDPGKDFHYDVPCDGSITLANNISFEVIAAEVIKEGRSGHVNYTILINPYKDVMKPSQTVIKRRYSDFEQLHHKLKKKFSTLMANVSFPRKVFLGNFTSETIAKRSIAFEQYLTHLFSFLEIRYCNDFFDFFVQGDFYSANQSFLTKDYNNAVALFEQILPVIEKLYSNSHPIVFNCLCGLVVSYMKLEKYAVAEACSQVALKCPGPLSDEMMASLLVTSIRLCWTLNKDKVELEKRLEDLKSKGVNVTRDLHDILLITFHPKSGSHLAFN